MKSVVTAEQMRAIDAATIETIGLPGVVLMENAGRAAATVVMNLAPSRAAPIVVVCGGGNNGGDGYVIARVLREHGYFAQVYLAVAPSRVAGDARTHFEAYQKCGGAVILIADDEQLERHVGDIVGATIIVDALFGTGLERNVEGTFRRIIESINQSTATVVAVDVPSGLSSDTGRALGIAARADHTVTFGFHKIATASAPGFAACGDVTVAEIGIPSELADAHGVSVKWVEASDVASRLPEVSALDYKNRRGHVVAIAGAPGTWGAGRLCALAALRSGAGLVTLVSTAIDGNAPDPVMTHAVGNVDGTSFAQLVHGKSSIAIGPGMVTGDIGRALVECAVGGTLPLVVDADGLNMLAGRPELLRGSQAVITPHPGEAARLLDKTTTDVEGERVETVRELADATGAVAVLKGARTLVAFGDTVFVIPTGSPALATAGSGDVLTGMIAGLVAQGLTLLSAALAGVYVHGLAGEMVAERLGVRGATATDVLETIPAAMVAAANSAHG